MSTYQRLASNLEQLEEERSSSGERTTNGTDRSSIKSRGRDASKDSSGIATGDSPLQRASEVLCGDRDHEGHQKHLKSRRRTRRRLKYFFVAALASILLVAVIVLVLIPEFKKREARDGDRKQKEQKVRLVYGRPAVALNLLSDSSKDSQVELREVAAKLAAISIPRVVGSDNHTRVRGYLVSKLNEYGFNVSITSHKFGKYVFRNVIGTLRVPNFKREKSNSATNTKKNKNFESKDSKKPAVLLLSAHYDSLSTVPGFQGAMDSAAPCVILLEVARRLQIAGISESHLPSPSSSFNSAFTDGASFLSATESEEEKQAHSEGSGVIRIVFFDGEEAFKEWTDTDSLYGARGLATDWDSKGETKQISLMVLLDLIGAKDQPTLTSKISSTENLFNRLAMWEKCLRFTKKISNIYEKKDQTYFAAPNVPFSSLPTKRGEQVVTVLESRLETPFMKQHVDRWNIGSVEDDHKPFVRRGVPVVHVIATPFPSSWHTLRDNIENIDKLMLVHFAQIFAVFTAEYVGYHIESEHCEYKKEKAGNNSE